MPKNDQVPKNGNKNFRLIDERLVNLYMELSSTNTQGIGKFRDTLGIEIHVMIFIGDALFPSGNDHPAKEAGVVTIRVKDPNETKRMIETIVACLDNVQNTKHSEEEVYE